MILFLGITLAVISAFFGVVVQLNWLGFLQTNGDRPVPGFFSLTVYGILLAGLVFHLCTIFKWRAIDYSSWPRLLRPTAKTLVFGAPLFIGMFGVTLSYLVLCGSISAATVLGYMGSKFGWDFALKNVRVTVGRPESPWLPPIDCFLEAGTTPEAAPPVEPGPESPPVIPRSGEEFAEIQANLHQAFGWIEWGSGFFGCLLTLLLVTRLRLPVFWHISNVAFMSLVAMFRSARKLEQTDAGLQSGPIINMQPEWLDCFPVLLGAALFLIVWWIRRRKVPKSIASPREPGAA